SLRSKLSDFRMCLRSFLHRWIWSSFELTANISPIPYSVTSNFLAKQTLSGKFIEKIKEVVRGVSNLIVSVKTQTLNLLSWSSLNLKSRVDLSFRLGSKRFTS